MSSGISRRGIEAEEYEINQLLWDLEDLKYQATVSDDPTEPSYGFDSPALQIRLWEKGADTPKTLVVGNKLPEGETCLLPHERRRKNRAEKPGRVFS